MTNPEFEFLIIEATVDFDFKGPTKVAGRLELKRVGVGDLVASAREVAPAARDRKRLSDFLMRAAPGRYARIAGRLFVCVDTGR